METGFPKAEPTALVLEEGAMPTIKELLLLENMAFKVEATMPPLIPEVTVLAASIIELEGRTATLLRSQFRFYLFLQLRKVTFHRDLLPSFFYLIYWI